MMGRAGELCGVGAEQQKKRIPRFARNDKYWAALAVRADSKSGVKPPRSKKTPA
jgi:hypothetical protein